VRYLVRYERSIKLLLRIGKGGGAGVLFQRVVETTPVRWPFVLVWKNWCHRPKTGLHVEFYDAIAYDVAYLVLQWSQKGFGQYVGYVQCTLFS
jgi:hypothetical protein